MTVDVQQAATSCVGKQQNSKNTSKTFQLTISLKYVVKFRSENYNQIYSLSQTSDSLTDTL
ncbi:unnamed protein product [Meloidogyne enterolobii]|uniref:Uncharacterized protein n=1 Tax=Meloidogyne enterolobii TaxID=390850 RepID=A0ACB0YUG9_MELEN